MAHLTGDLGFLQKGALSSSLLANTKHLQGEGYLHGFQHRSIKRTHRLKSVFTIARMPSQGEMVATLPFAFFIDLQEGGQLRTKNDPATQEQRPIITTRGEKTPYKADVQLVTCVHGRLSEKEPTFASLVVFEYHVGCTGSRQKYASLDTEFTFTNHDTPNAKDKPFIKAWAPFKRFEMIDPVEVEYTKKVKAEGSVGASSTPANAGMSFSTETEKKYKLLSYASGQSFPSSIYAASSFDTILWQLRQDELKGVGVPDTFRVALLIERPNMDKFTGTFVLRLHAGIWHAVAKTFKMVFGRSSCEDDPIIFNPLLGPQGEVTGINPLSLGDYADNNKLESLAPIHVPS